MKNNLLILLIISAFNGISQDFNLETKIVASDRHESDQFGKVVAIDGEIAVVGVPQNDLNESGTDSIYGAGAAYVFVRDAGGVWSEKQKLVANDRAFMDGFGNAVTISGSYIAIGASTEDHNSVGLDSLKSAGSVYIFEKQIDDSWLQIAKVVASDRNVLDYFGIAIALYGDVLVVGAEAEDEDASGSNTITSAGSAYIFRRDVAGNWIEEQKIVASSRHSGDDFGASVDIDQETIIVGANRSDFNPSGTDSVYQAGSVYIFEYDGTKWTETANLVSWDRAELDQFGQSVAISGSVCVIGAIGEDEDATGANTLDRAGSAYIFTKDGGGNWIQTKKLVASDRNAHDGFATTIDIDGHYIIAGAAGQDENENGLDSLLIAGAIYIFEKAVDGTWNQLQKIVPSDRTMFDTFGVSVALSGKYLIAGANLEDHTITGNDSIADAGSAYIFETLAILSTTSETSSQAFTINPNPASDQLTVVGAQMNTLGTIRDLSGKLILSFTTGNSDSTQLSVQQLRQGSYIITIGDYSQKLIVSQ